MPSGPILPWSMPSGPILPWSMPSGPILPWSISSKHSSGSISGSELNMSSTWPMSPPKKVSATILSIISSNASWSSSGASSGGGCMLSSSAIKAIGSTPRAKRVASPSAHSGGRSAAAKLDMPSAISIALVIRVLLCFIR